MKQVLQMKIKEFIRQAVERAPEIGVAGGAAAGGAAGLIIDLYRASEPSCQGLNCPAPYGIIPAITATIGGAVGAGVGNAIRGVYEHPQAAVKALGAGAVTALLTYGLSQNLPGPLPAIFSVECGGLGAAAGYILGRIREDRFINLR